MLLATHQWVVTLRLGTDAEENGGGGVNLRVRELLKTFSLKIVRTLHLTFTDILTRFRSVVRDNGRIRQRSQRYRKLVLNGYIVLTNAIGWDAIAPYSGNKFCNKMAATNPFQG